MEFRLNYFRLIMPLFVFDIGALLLLHDANTSLLYWVFFALLSDCFFALIWILSSPLVWIRIDQANDALTYQLFLQKPTTVSLSIGKSRVTTRIGGGQNFRITEFQLYVRAQKVGTAHVPIWSIDEIEALNQLLNE